MSLHSLRHSRVVVVTDTVSHQGRKCHVSVLLRGITLLYETSMQKIWKWSSDLLLGKKQREAGALRPEQGYWHCSSWGASEMCWKDHNLEGPDARMQGIHTPMYVCFCCLTGHMTLMIWCAEGVRSGCEFVLPLCCQGPTQCACTPGWHCRCLLWWDPRLPLHPRALLAPCARHPPALSSLYLWVRA